MKNSFPGMAELTNAQNTHRHTKPGDGLSRLGSAVSIRDYYIKQELSKAGARHFGTIEPLM